MCLYGIWACLWGAECPPGRTGGMHRPELRGQLVRSELGGAAGLLWQLRPRCPFAHQCAWCFLYRVRQAYAWCGEAYYFVSFYFF